MMKSLSFLAADSFPAINSGLLIHAEVDALFRESQGRHG
jgi:hypothetical protein